MGTNANDLTKMYAEAAQHATNRTGLRVARVEVRRFNHDIIGYRVTFTNGSVLFIKGSATSLYV